MALQRVNEVMLCSLVLEQMNSPCLPITSFGKLCRLSCFLQSTCESDFSFHCIQFKPRLVCPFVMSIPAVVPKYDILIIMAIKTVIAASHDRFDMTMT